MKVKNLVFRVYTLIVPVIILLISGCQDPILVGSDLLDDDKINIEILNNFDLSTYTVPGERVATHSPANYSYYRLGEIKNDPIYGSVAAELFLKFRFNAVSPTYHTDDNVTFDSLVLVMAYDSTATYGNKTGNQEINVYQLESEFISSKATDLYYSDTKLPFVSIPLVTKTTQIKPKDSVSITSHLTGKVVKQVPQLRLRLSDDFGIRLITNQNAAKTDTAFRSFMKGVYITSKSTDNNPLLYGFNFSNSSLSGTSPVNKLILYYTSKDTIKKEYEFPIDGATINSYFHDRSGSQLETFISNPTLGDSLSFTHGIGGVRTKIEFKDLNTLKDTLINKAELEIYVADIPTQNGIFATPTQIIATRLNEKGEHILIDDIGPGSIFITVFGGKLISDAKGKKYVMNVTNHIKQASKNPNYNSEIFLSVLAEPENPGRTAFFGAKHSKFPVKLTVTYTKN